MARAIMIQGTGSNVGKSLIVAGLARALKRRGISVAPFKPQNMSNNAAVTEDAGEIGRAQALQARASGLSPHTDMNPVLLKPESDTGAQIVLQGQRLGHAEARSYQRDKSGLMPHVLESFHRLEKRAEIILVEGAGSPAEINLRRGDIANMGFARAAGIPVVLVGDIDRGGVIAQIVGTKTVLAADDAACIKAFAVNRFRGDRSLFDNGRDEIVQRTNWPCLGVIPWFDDAWKLPAEDMLDIASRPGGACKVVVPQLARMANFDDLDPLASEPAVTVDIVRPGRALPGDADLILIPGSKTTLGDLKFLKEQGWDIDMQAHLRRGGHILGLCGGYQMLGTRICDPDGVDGVPGEADGLGFLDITTEMVGQKKVVQRTGTAIPGGEPVSGYEIHMGRTQGPDCARAWLNVEGTAQGAASANGLVMGCYMHGLFSSDEFRKSFLKRLGHRSTTQYEADVEKTLDALAEHLEKYWDIDRLLEIAAEPDQSIF